MPFDENPSTPAFVPAMLHPAGAMPGRHFPSTRDPYVAAAVPAVIPGNPDIAATRQGTSGLDDSAWRTNANKYFSGEGAAG